MKFYLIGKIEGCLFNIVPLWHLYYILIFFTCVSFLHSLLSVNTGCRDEWMLIKQPVSKSLPKIPFLYICRRSSCFFCFLCFWYIVLEFNCVVSCSFVQLRNSTCWQQVPRTGALRHVAGTPFSPFVLLQAPFYFNHHCLFGVYQIFMYFDLFLDLLFFFTNLFIPVPIIKQFAVWNTF